ncbi:DUF2878 domain-containing protein [Pseudomethylobacillus aquaticus]|nr:DUF2878 domain-containing protein [Pseudomethylobacillus aquaticus]
MRVAINFIAFQLGWLACVIGAAQGMPWLGPLVALVVVLWHLRHKADAGRELSWILAAVAVGSLFDQALLSLGWISFVSSSWPAWLLPAWMVSLWLLFCTTLNVSMRWMHGRWLIAMVFGAVGGPLAYLAGAKLGAMSLLDTEAMLIALAIGWGCLMPALLWLSARFDGNAVSK